MRYSSARVNFWLSGISDISSRFNFDSSLLSPEVLVPKKGSYVCRPKVGCEIHARQASGPCKASWSQTICAQLRTHWVYHSLSPSQKMLTTDGRWSPDSGGIATEVEPCQNSGDLELFLEHCSHSSTWRGGSSRRLFASFTFSGAILRPSSPAAVNLNFTIRDVEHCASLAIQVKVTICSVNKYWPALL
jgi:hypothetical protein